MTAIGRMRRVTRTLAIVTILPTLSAVWLTTSAPAAAAATAASIATGDFHSCAVTTTAAVKCWGYNEYGQLGNNSTSSSEIPVGVSGLGSGVASIAAGSSHTCALTTVGGVKCWGNNGDGQLGDNSTDESWVPVDVSGLSSGVVAITSGALHTCALTTVGGVKCWGNNEYGQLGDNSTDESWIPVDVSGLSSGVASIGAGKYHTCAVTTGGAAKCWGYNSYGQLGDNSTDGSWIPVDVSGLSSGVGSIVGGTDHTCALTTGGAMQCWGSNERGQLGNNSTTASGVPVNVSGFGSGVASITAHANNTCARTTGGAMRCWGYAHYGQIGDGASNKDRLVPVNVVGLAAGVASIGSGEYHTCASTTGGAVKCWGWNRFGQIGNDSTDNTKVPTNVSGFTLPPTKTSLTINAPGKTAKGKKAAVTGKLTSSDKACAAIQPLTLSYGANETSTMTKTNGSYAFSFKVPKSAPGKNIVVQVAFAKTQSCLASKSPKGTIKFT
jgi:alpha-tubulin suppressor-like RCC1 family protein